jgi:5'(3')-deoxyribonucleotidase
MKRFAIDMDEVMADTIAHFLEKYNSSFGCALTPLDFHGQPGSSAGPDAA